MFKINNQIKKFVIKVYFVKALIKKKKYFKESDEIKINSSKNNAGLDFQINNNNSSFIYIFL